MHGITYYIHEVSITFDKFRTNRGRTSNRTLQRQLANEKTTFQILLSESRQEKAKALLKENKLSIQEISNLLGYADISHFSRAFKKWTNMTPSNYRIPK